MFLCSVDQKNQAAFCCTCNFPLPFLCKDCIQDHCSKPGEPHNVLPISANAEIVSKRDFVRLQRKLHDLALTNGELKEVRAAFEKARGDIEAAYREIEELLQSTRDKYLEKLSKSAEVYEELFMRAMQQCREHAWKDADFRPADQLAALLWKHTPGQEPDFGFSFQQFLHKELVEKLFNVKWLLPFPALSYPEDCYAIKVDLQATHLNVLVEGNQTIAEVKWFLKSRFPHLQIEGKLFQNGRQLLDSGTLQGIERGAVLSLDQPQYQVWNRSTSDEFIIIAQGNSRSIESLTIRIQDQADFPTAPNFLDACRILTSYKLPPNALLCVGFHLSKYMQITVKVMATGHFLHLEAYSSATILELKSKIQEIKGFRPNLQVLTYGEDTLKDDRTMESYGISQESTLQLTHREDSCLSF